MRRGVPEIPQGLPEAPSSIQEWLTLPLVDTHEDVVRAMFDMNLPCRMILVKEAVTRPIFEPEAGSAVDPFDPLGLIYNDYGDTGPSGVSGSIEAHPAKYRGEIPRPFEQLLLHHMHWVYLNFEAAQFDAIHRLHGAGDFQGYVGALMKESEKR